MVIDKMIDKDNRPLLYGWLGCCLSRAAALPASRAAAAPR
jgi:hypothetical protein